MNIRIPLKRYCVHAQKLFFSEKTMYLLQSMAGAIGYLVFGIVMFVVLVIGLKRTTKRK